MPDTITSVASTPPPPAAPRAEAPIPLLKPTVFIDTLTDVVVPLLDEEGVPESRRALARVLAPCFAGYAVSDALLALAQIRVAIEGNQVSDRGRDALCETMYLLEGFITNGWAAGPRCLAAQAVLMQRHTDAPFDGRGGAWGLSDESVRSLAWRLKSDVSAEAPAFHSRGSRFDDCLRDYDNWLDDYLPSVGEGEATDA